MGTLKPTKLEVSNFLESIINTKITELTPVGYGEWSNAFIFRAKGQEWVVRFSGLKEDFEKDKFAADHFTTSTLPIPKVTEIGEVFGGYYAISRKAPGKPIDLVSQNQMTKLMPAIFKLFDSMRQTDISYATGYGSWNEQGNAPFQSWKEFLLDIDKDHPDSRLDGWRSNLEGFPKGKVVFNQSYEKMCSLVERCPENRFLIHADLLHYNLLVEDNRITSVLDWGCSKYGDFLYELAWFTYFLPWHKYMNHIDVRGEAVKHFEEINIDIPHFDERLKCYEIHIGLDSLAYCAYKKDWKVSKEVAEHTLKVANIN